MTDQEWQEGIERALNVTWLPPSDPLVKAFAAQLAKELPVRIALVYTNKDQRGHFRVGPARDEGE